LSTHLYKKVKEEIKETECINCKTKLENLKWRDNRAYTTCYNCHKEIVLIKEKKS